METASTHSCCWLLTWIRFLSRFEAPPLSSLFQSATFALHIRIPDSGITNFLHQLFLFAIAYLTTKINIQFKDLKNSFKLCYSLNVAFNSKKYLQLNVIQVFSDHIVGVFLCKCKGLIHSLQFNFLPPSLTWNSPLTMQFLITQFLETTAPEHITEFSIEQLWKDKILLHLRFDQITYLPIFYDTFLHKDRITHLNLWTNRRFFANDTASNSWLVTNRMFLPDHRVIDSLHFGRNNGP